VDWVLRCLAAVNITTGPFHFEAVEGPDGEEFAEHPLLCPGDDTARRWAVEHPNLPTDVLVALVDDPDLARRAAANPSLPVEVMERLITR
jgi:hypothetical protein